MQADLEIVFAVDREVMTDSDPAARPKREVLAHTAILHQEDRHLVRLGRRAMRYFSDRQPPDLPRRREIALHQRGRDREHIGHVVEAVLVEVVGR